MDGQRRQVQAWLTVPFAEKEAAKRAGARWCPAEERWYAPFGADIALMLRWLEVRGGKWKRAVEAKA